MRIKKQFSYLLVKIGTSSSEQPASSISRITAPSILANVREDRSFGDPFPTRSLAETLRAATRDAEHDSFHTPAARPKFNYQKWLMQQATAPSTATNTSAYPSLSLIDGGTNSVDGPATLTAPQNRQQYVHERERDGHSPPSNHLEHIAQLVEQNRELSGIAVGMMDQFIQVF